MADRDTRLPDNAPGRFYVDENCIDCDLCRTMAPGNFERNDEGGYSHVIRQPEDEAEAELCREAMDTCPVEAIGDDGEVLEDEKDGAPETASQKVEGS